MHITVNGEANELDEADVNLARLLEIKRVESPEMIAVQLNGEFVDMESYPSIYLKAGDDVEFLYFMGGGSL
jgi:sulfur carrier protein